MLVLAYVASLFIQNGQGLGISQMELFLNSKAIKIKCLSSKSNISGTEACDDKTFLLNLVDGMPRLRKSTIIIIIQSVMAITGTKEIDFIVYKNETLHLEAIKLEKERWHKDIVPPLRKIYFDFLASGF